MSAPEKRLEDAVLGSLRQAPTNALGANIGARNVVGSFAIDYFERHRLEHPGRRYCLVTLFSDRWLSFDRLAAVWLGGITAASRQVMQLGAFDGWLAVTEFQTLVEIWAPLGRVILPNVHAVAWSDDPSFSFEAAEQRMAASRRLVSHIKAETASVSLRADTSPTNLIAYLLKGACVGKYRVPSKGSPSSFRLDDCALPPRAAARQTELLSSIYLDELIFAGGDVAAIRRVLVEQLHKAVRSASIDQPCVDQARDLWRRTRPRSKAHYHDVAVCRGDRQLPSDLAIYSLLDRGLNGALRDGTVQRLLGISASIGRDADFRHFTHVEAGSLSNEALQLAIRSAQRAQEQESRKHADHA